MKQRNTTPRQVLVLILAALGAVALIGILSFWMFGPSKGWVYIVGTAIVIATLIGIVLLGVGVQSFLTKKGRDLMGAIGIINSLFQLGVSVFLGWVFMSAFTIEHDYRKGEISEIPEFPATPEWTLVGDILNFALENDVNKLILLVVSLFVGGSAVRTFFSFPRDEESLGLQRDGESKN